MAVTRRKTPVFDKVETHSLTIILAHRFVTHKELNREIAPRIRRFLDGRT